MTNHNIKITLKGLQQKIDFIQTTENKILYNYLNGKKQAYLDVLGFFSWSGKKQLKFMKEINNYKQQ